MPNWCENQIILETDNRELYDKIKGHLEYDAGNNLCHADGYRYKQKHTAANFNPSLNPGKQAVFTIFGHLFRPLQEK